MTRQPPWTINYYATDRGNSQPVEFLDELPERERSYIEADIATFREHGDRAPISIRPVKGKRFRGLSEIRTLGFRTIFAHLSPGDVWILHVCKKQDERHGYEQAQRRLKLLRGE